MVFRRDSKVDAFQRQINALRQQLGGEHDEFAMQDMHEGAPNRAEGAYRSSFPALDSLSGDHLALDFGEPSRTDERPSPVPAVPAADTMTSIIAHTAVWTGTLESTGSLHVHGRVEGSLTAREDVFIAEEAEVDATVNATCVTVAGNVRGTIRCAQRFELLPRGRVAGDVHAPVIVIHEGAAIAGEIAMTGGDAKSLAAPSLSSRSARG